MKKERHWFEPESCNIEQKEFCANPLCQNHLLLMNEERHYHACDNGVYAPNLVIYSKRYDTIKIIKRKFRKDKIKVTVKYFCENCLNVINMIHKES